MTRKAKNKRAINAFYPLYFIETFWDIDKVCGNLIEITPDGSYKNVWGVLALRYKVLRHHL